MQILSPLMMFYSKLEGLQLQLLDIIANIRHDLIFVLFSKCQTTQKLQNHEKSYVCFMLISKNATHTYPVESFHEQMSNERGRYQPPISINISVKNGC